ncbi:MAG: hypothetical protein K2I07_02995 [Lachnospiraceae bacterium]|nr:hypothetical protein [Lachnospiraceae bacterium]
MKKVVFKPSFTVKNTAKAQSLAKLPVGAEILKGHHQAAGTIKHKHQVAF